MDYVYVNTDNTLRDVCAAIRETATIGVDTEFLREKTYFAQLCLVQISGKDIIACIDPIDLENIDPVLDIIYDTGITKIFHSGRQDWEVLYDIKKTLPDNIYDTQLAATFLGHGEQIGYAALVQEVLGVSLAKTETRTNWSKRPLNDRQLAYAADDVRYLLSLYDDQTEKLANLRRLDWMKEDMSHLAQTALMEKPPEQLWMRVKNWQQLHDQELAVLQALSIWREEVAVKKNRPRRWILSDAKLVELARLQGGDNSLRIKEILPENALHKYADSILCVMTDARRIAPEHWPQCKGRYDFSAAQSKTIKQISKLIKSRAEKYEMAAPLIASRKEVEAVVLGSTSARIFQGWRYEIVGEEILSLLNHPAQAARPAERVTTK